MTFALATPQGQVRQYTRLHDATKAADKVVAEVDVEVKVIHVETDSVAYLASPAKVRKETEGVAYNPWTRLEQPKFAARDFDGWTPAYTRSRIQATVYRNNAYERGASNNWRVLDGRSGKFRDVRDTKAARLLTTAMKNGLVLD